MCFHRKEVCMVCKCPIHDMIVVCPDAKNRITVANPIINQMPKVMTYTPENVKRIMSVYPHEMPTIERNSSLCQNHYMVALAGIGPMSYEQYRARADTWMKM
jgi:hypothetical protein